MPDQDHILVIDSGLFVHAAGSLDASSYYCEWRSGFSESKRSVIGTGLGFDRPLDLWPALSKDSTIVFPDVTTADMAQDLRRRGFSVFGATTQGAELELDRWGFRKILKAAGLPVTDATKITGTKDLEKYLKETPECYVKYSRGRFRGDMETYHHEGWPTSEEWLQDLSRFIGPVRDSAVFIIEDEIEGTECALDEYSVDGKYPETTLIGWEEKNAGYIGKVIKRKDAPEGLLDVTKRLSHVLEERGHRGWVAFETILGKRPYVTDPCVRLGSPPSEALMELYGNWQEIVIEGAKGNLVEPEPRHEYVAELILKSEFAVEHFLVVSFPEELRNRVRLHNHAKIDGVDYVIPTRIAEIGAAIGFGSTMEEAKAEAIKVGDAIQATDLDYDSSSLDNLEEKAKAVGIDL